jgi:2-keto-4-pentenoate hydratase/2-oxohepta-3-ene-1,7-dioic acid hydratase in catechol pathway
MKIAQFETAEGLLVGLHHRGAWLNYTKAEAFFHLSQATIAFQRLTTVGLMLDSGMLEPRRIRTVLRFVDATRLMPQLAVPKDALLRAPLLRPAKIIALGLNYAQHVREGTFALPEEPVLFLKAGSSVIGPGETVRIPRGLGRIDHEVELAVVIGKKASAVRKRDAFACVAGYTIINDVTARELQAKDQEKRHPWFRSKSFDTFTPMGPWIVTADEIRPPVRLSLECRVNGRLRQRSNTRHLVFDIPTVIASITRHITLEPGDVISTGTPAGIGPVRHGDEMACTIEKIGTLRNPVRYG